MRKAKVNKTANAPAVDDYGFLGVWRKTEHEGHCSVCNGSGQGRIAKITYNDKTLLLCAICMDSLWALLDSMLEDTPEPQS